VRAYQYRAALRMLDRDNDAAIVWGNRTIELATALGDHRTLAGAHVTVGSSLMLEGRTGYVDHFERAIALAETHGLTVVHANAHLNRGSGAGELYRFDEAERHLRVAVAIAERHDMDAQASYSLAWLALTRLERGDWDEAAALAGRTLARASASTITRIMALTALGRLRVRRGDPEAWPRSTRPSNSRSARARCSASPRCARRGRRPLGTKETSTACASRPRPPSTSPSRRATPGSWESSATGAASRVTSTNFPRSPPSPSRSRCRGRHREAAAAWEALGCPFETARALAESADVDDVREAVDGFTRLGARVAAERARARLHELGATRVPRGPRERTRRHPAGLTPREAQVLTRLAEGMSNAEIAARHRVSTRTVEHQVSSVLSKLGVDSRTAAVAEAHRRGLVDPT
jgi:DNA-binding CsgD family transcriptional regulator